MSGWFYSLNNSFTGGDLGTFQLDIEHIRRPESTTVDPDEYPAENAFLLIDAGINMVFVPGVPPKVKRQFRIGYRTEFISSIADRFRIDTVCKFTL
jgi:hypothetical protein